MSLKLMVRVMEEVEVSRPQQAILLAMAENAADDGSRCFPSVDLIAWKAGYKRRQVVTIMRELRDLRIIEEVHPAHGTRPSEYQIRLENAPRKQSFEEWREQNQRQKSKPEGVQSDVSRGAISGHEEDAEGCNLASPGVQSDVRGVQPDVSRGAMDCTQNRRTVIEPLENRHIARERAQAPPEKPKPKPKPKRATQIPPDWQPAEGLRKWSVDNGFTPEDLDQQVPQFVDHFLAKGEARSDWDATFRNWMRNARRFGHTFASPDAQHKPPRNLKTNKEREDKSVWLGDWPEYTG